jgi:hypothetical protein
MLENDGSASMTRNLRDKTGKVLRLQWGCHWKKDSMLELGKKEKGSR